MSKHSKAPLVPNSDIVPMKQKKPASKTFLSLVQSIMNRHGEALNRELSAACAVARDEAKLDASWMFDLSKSAWVKQPKTEAAAKEAQA